jgi:hypothetical protein
MESISVSCDGQFSHFFNLRLILPASQGQPLASPLNDPIAYGKALYSALFPYKSLALHCLESQPQRLLLIAAIIWPAQGGNSDRQGVSGLTVWCERLSILETLSWPSPLPRRLLVRNYLKMRLPMGEDFARPAFSLRIYARC